MRITDAEIEAVATDETARSRSFGMSLTERERFNKREALLRAEREREAREYDERVRRAEEDFKNGDFLAYWNM